MKFSFTLRSGMQNTNRSLCFRPTGNSPSRWHFTPVFLLFSYILIYFAFLRYFNYTAASRFCQEKYGFGAVQPIRLHDALYALFVTRGGNAVFFAEQTAEIELVFIAYSRGYLTDGKL